MNQLDAMRAWGREILAATGLESSAVESTLRSLQYAEERGLSSHGYLRLPTYVSRLRAGGIAKIAELQVVSNLPALSIVDADAGIGAYSGEFCADLAVRKATEQGLGLVVARNANHFGAAGYFVDRIATSGFLGVAVCNTDSVMCAPFGGRPILGSNPISIGVPAEVGARPILDMATTEVSQGKIILARDRNEKIPLGWAVDCEGLQTTDPTDGLAGALLPSGGTKGFGLALMVDCLVAISGAQVSNLVSPLYGDPSEPQRLGHAFLAIAIDPVLSRDDYMAKVSNLVDAVHQSGLASATRPPMVPGEPELARMASHTEWTADSTTVKQFREISAEYSIEIPREFN